jgi:hypothetical protein
MAATSSSSGSGSIVDVVDEELSYGALLGRGLDMDVLMAEYLVRTGPDGVRAMARAVNLATAQDDDFELVETLGAYEHLKSAVGAKQSELACTLGDVVAADRIVRGVRVKNPQWGVGAEVGLALHASQRSGARFLNRARILTEDLPCTRQGLQEGTINSEEAKLIVREVRRLKPVNRRDIDRMLFCETHTCFGQGGAKLREMIRQWALILEPEAEVDLEERAMRERHVEVLQVDPCRVRLTGMLPLEYGAALCQVMAREIGRAQAAGDPRTQGQVAADFFFESLTGIGDHTNIPVEVSLVMTDRTLYQGHPEPAVIPGYGYISAVRARELFVGNPENPLDSWIRRLYTAPGTGDLVAMDSKARLFTGGLKCFITLRDRYCRTPYCNGKIEHLDHVVQASRGGPSTAENSGGRCRLCNAAKEAPDWEEHTVPGDRHTIRITTSSRHPYTSTAPPLPGTRQYNVRPINPADRPPRRE